LIEANALTTTLRRHHWVQDFIQAPIGGKLPNLPNSPQKLWQGLQQHQKSSDCSDQRRCSHSSTSRI